LRNTDYATELATASLSVGVDEVRIERLHVKETDVDEIRFSWWRDGKLIPRPLDVPEDLLLDMFREALIQRVFTDSFILALSRMLLAEPLSRAKSTVGE
jgi:hypothetical protein